MLLQERYAVRSVSSSEPIEQTGGLVGDDDRVIEMHMERPSRSIDGNRDLVANEIATISPGSNSVSCLSCGLPSPVTARNRSSSLARLRVIPAAGSRGTAAARIGERRENGCRDYRQLKTDWVKFDTATVVSTLERSNRACLTLFGIRQGVSESAGVADDRNRSHTAYGDYTEADRYALPDCAALSHGRRGAGNRRRGLFGLAREMPNFLEPSRWC